MNDTSTSPALGSDHLEYERWKPSRLDHSKPSIRLVCVLQGSGLIRCEMRHETMATNYTCLSYRWGDDDASHLILINGKTALVRRNLFDFLETQRLISTATKTWLWIDALCIDQSYVAERNHQVRQMGSIYSQAQEVIIWLGSNPLLNPIFLTLRKEVKSVTFNEWCAVRRHSASLVDHILNNEYWNRAWITQEIFLARKRVILLDNEKFLFNELIDIMDFYYLPRKTATSFSRNVVPQEQIIGAPLKDLLARFADKQCSIPRDRIFSLLSLCIGVSSFNIDYNLSDAEILAQVLRHDENQNCLCTAIAIAKSAGLTDLTSSQDIVHSHDRHMEKTGAQAPIQNNFIEMDVYPNSIIWNNICMNYGRLDDIILMDGHGMTFDRCVCFDTCSSLGPIRISSGSSMYLTDDISVWNQSPTKQKRERLCRYGDGIEIVLKGQPRTTTSAQKSFEYLTRRVEGELRNKTRSGTVKYIYFKPDVSWKAEVIESFNQYRSGSMLRGRTDDLFQHDDETEGKWTMRIAFPVLSKMMSQPARTQYEESLSRSYGCTLPGARDKALLNHVHWQAAQKRVGPEDVGPWRVLEVNFVPTIW